jgi:hypothetical protein
MKLKSIGQGLLHQGSREMPAFGKNKYFQGRAFIILSFGNN